MALPDSLRTTEHQRLLDLFRTIAIELKVGTIRALADKYDISEEAIYKWCRQERVPISWAKRFELDTKGAFPRQVIATWAYH
jgi:transposase-like protein